MLIAFEGTDGVGKTTQLQRLNRNLNNLNYKTYLFDMGSFERFENYLQDLKHNNYECSAQLRELLYYFEGTFFSQFYVNELEEQYDFVICDRWILTYYAYGLNNGLSREDLEFFTKSIQLPDLTFYFNLDSDVALERIKAYRNIDRAEIGYGNAWEIEENKRDKKFLENQNIIKRNFESLLYDKKYNVKIVNSAEAEHVIEKTILNMVLKTIKNIGG